MKKVAILNIYQGLVERGSETLIDNISTRLSGDFDITIFSGGKVSRKPYKNIVVPSVWNLSVDVSRSLFLRILRKFYLDPYSLEVFLFTLFCLPKLIKGKFDVIISINGFWQLVLLRPVKFFSGSKIVSTGFAGIGKDSFWNAKMGFDAFIAMTKVAADWAREINPKIKIFTIGGGVDLKRFAPDGEKAKIDLEIPIILCVSALVPYKRVDLVIKAVGKLKKGSLLVLGDGYDREYLENLGQEILGERRFRILKVSYSDIDEFYRMADLFTLPSEEGEAFGIVYLEAAACGKPIVAPDDVVRREVVNGGGILVDVLDIDKYSKALEEALNREWDDLPQKQASKFSWDVIVKKYKEAINQI